MKEKITLRKLAAELGIAPATVLRALNGHPNVRHDLRKKVALYAAQRGYSLPNHHTGNIAIVIPNMTLQHYLGAMLNALYAELNSAGYHVYILTEADLSSLNEYEFDGIISTSWIPGLEKEFPKAHALPFVSVNTLDNRIENIYSVVSDDFTATMDGMEFLYQAGCRRIFLLLGSTDTSLGSTRRESAFLQFCRAHGLPIENFISRISGEQSLQSCMERAIQLQADAVFCVSEGRSQKVYSILHKLGLRIPEDISVLGLEIPHKGADMEPPLTAFRQDYPRIAKESVGMLLSLIRGEKVRKSIIVPFQFTKRESVKENRIRVPLFIQG